jgi:hypothetical protein
MSQSSIKQYTMGVRKHGLPVADVSSTPTTQFQFQQTIDGTKAAVSKQLIYCGRRDARTRSSSARLGCVKRPPLLNYLKWRLRPRT